MPRPTSLPGLPADYTSKVSVYTSHISNSMSRSIAEPLVQLRADVQFFAGDTVRPVGGNDKQIARVLVSPVCIMAVWLLEAPRLRLRRPLQSI